MHDGEVQPATRRVRPMSTIRHILRVPFIAHVTNRSAQPPVTQTVMLRRLRFGHIVRSDSDEDHTRALNAGIDDPWRSGDDLVVVLVKCGYAPPRIWGCGRPGTELMTVNSSVKSWKRRRSCRGMLHDDDDDEIQHNAATSQNFAWFVLAGDIVYACLLTCVPLYCNTLSTPNESHDAAVRCWHFATGCIVVQRPAVCENITRQFSFGTRTPCYRAGSAPFRPIPFRPIPFRPNLFRPIPSPNRNP